MMQMPIFILIVGLIYWIEILSVMIQVTYFKKTAGKRIFKMAPIHHHFELCGWSETRVVAVFSVATAILCLIGLLGIIGGRKYGFTGKDRIDRRCRERAGALPVNYLEKRKLHTDFMMEIKNYQKKNCKKMKSGRTARSFVGELPMEILADTGLAVLSPGVPTDLPVIVTIKEQGIPIWGEIELAYHFAKGRLLAITGTNGKTTTTSLLGEIMQAYFGDVKVVGNIGIPYTSVAADTTEATVTVAEISSFQLETAVDFHPQVSAILNITPDHLNRHHTMECYIEAKESHYEEPDKG